MSLTKREYFNEINGTETLTTYGAIDERVEIARLQGYNAGYRIGVIDGRSQKLSESLEAPKETHDIWFLCDVCGTDYFGTNEVAKEIGWCIGKGMEICPDHD